MIDSWAPTLSQLEAIVTMARARLPLASIAAEIGCTEEFLRAWLARLDAAPQIDPPKPAAGKPVVDERAMMRLVFKGEL